MRLRPALAGVAFALATSACGALPLPGSAPAATPTSIATAVPTAAATPARVAAAASPSPVAAPSPTRTPEPASANTVFVGNTDGEGVYIRKTPAMDDRLRAYPDGTPLTVIGDDVDGDDQHWHHVRTPDGLEGYVPAMYTTDTKP